MSDKRIFALFLVSIIGRIRYDVVAVYVALFLTTWVGAKPEVVSAFPTIQSVMILAVTVFVIPVIGYSRAPQKMTLGQLLAAISLLVIAASPASSSQGIVVSLAGAILLGASTAIINPYFSTVWHNSLKDDQRASILSVTGVIRTLLVSPFTYLAGIMFQWSPRWVMISCALLLLSVVGIMWYYKDSFGEQGSTLS